MSAVDPVASTAALLVATFKFNVITIEDGYIEADKVTHWSMICVELTARAPVHAACTLHAAAPYTAICPGS